MPRTETRIASPGTRPVPRRPARPLRACWIAVTTLLCAASPAGTLAASRGAETPPELGDVRWSRDFDTALAQAQRTGRPVFALFQEIPGCATCVGFGQGVLRNPLLVDAIEHEFTPVAIYNNRGGDDAKVLERYGEPAWNNPVVRFLDPDGRDLLPRRGGVYTARGIADRMLASLEAAERPVPAYLALARDETRALAGRRATFAMHCYWEGEACLGQLDGILSSHAGWLEGREVVELTYDPGQLSYPELVAAVARGGCARHVFTHGPDQAEAASAAFGDAVSPASRSREASADNQKYYLRRSPLRDADLTPLQQIRVNAALRRGQDPLVWLSPRQRAAYRSKAR